MNEHHEPLTRQETRAFMAVVIYICLFGIALTLALTVWPKGTSAAEATFDREADKAGISIPARQSLARAVCESPLGVESMEGSKIARLAAAAFCPEALR